MSCIPPGLHKTRTSKWRAPTETIQFRFRTRHITATGSAADGYHPNVRRLKIHPTVLERIIKAILALFPKFAQVHLRRWFPEWYLPPAIVIKSQKPDWEEEFDHELATYQSLQSLQGTVIPRHFGVIQYGGVRTHVLSDVGGICIPYTAETGEEAYLVVRNLLHQALKALAARGFRQDDTKLDNFHIVKDRVVVVDLERVERESRPEQLPKNIDSDLNTLMKQYRNYLDGMASITPRFTPR